MLRLKANRVWTERGGYGVDRQLKEMRSDSGVFWSPRSNSYVVSKRDDDRFVVYSINGIGEIRWYLDPEQPCFKGSQSGDDEAQLAFNYFFEEV